MRDSYDQLDADPRVADDVAYLDALLGVSPPVATAAEPADRLRFEALYARARQRAAAPRTPERPRPRRLAVLVAGGVAVLVVAAGLIGVGLWRPQPAYAATPAPLVITPISPGGRPVTLDMLARAAADHDDDAGVDLGVDHLVIDKWDLNSTVDGQRVTSAVIPSRYELWRAPDDRARSVTTDLPPQFPTGADRRAWRDAGSPRGGRQSTDYPADEFVTAFSGRARPPTDPDRLAPWLRRSAGGQDAVLNGALDLLGERALTGRELSSLLRVLASLRPAPVFAGTTTDRAGRVGAAFTVATRDTGAEMTRVLVFDTATGRVLSTEQILVSGATPLRLPRPAVVSYRTYRVAERIPAFP